LVKRRSPNPGKSPRKPGFGHISAGLRQTIGDR
jgi:hypothetical protein